jgi:hypothetical protein
MARGGLATAPLWLLHFQTPRLLHSAYLPSHLVNRAIHRTAVYGPVRAVVWEGRRRRRPPIPIKVLGSQAAATGSFPVRANPRAAISADCGGRLVARVALRWLRRQPLT